MLPFSQKFKTLVRARTRVSQVRHLAHPGAGHVCSITGIREKDREGVS